MDLEQPTGDEAKAADMFHRLGTITRQLHDALAELGYADKLKGTVEELPDAQSRLQYIARLTGEAAEKVLNRVDEAKAEQERVIKAAAQLDDTIARVPGLAKAMPELREWAQQIGKGAERTDQHLTEIMMAQDFHDLTGQVIKRVVTLAATIEGQLLELLLQAAPQVVAGLEKPADKEPDKDKPAPALQGPVVDPNGRSDVVTDQAGVDDLLASLGF